MRMQRCPHCGADNSLKRATCYNCEKQLAPSEGAARSQDRAPAASRWHALEPDKRKPTARPLEESVAKPLEARGTLGGAVSQADASARPAPRPAATPRSRNSMRHIRRMGMFYRELHTLLKAGINLSSACGDLELRAPAGFRGLAREMAAATASGQPISSVLDCHRDLIYPWHLGVVRAAEAAGSLPQALDQIATAYETEWETRSQVALQYFVYVYFGLPLVLCVVPVFAVLQKPIPKEGWNGALFAQAYLNTLRHTTLPVGLGLVGLALAWRVLATLPWFQAFQQHFVLALPLVGRLSRIAAAERYLTTLAMLLQAGVSLTDASTEAALAAGNPALTPKLLQLAPKLQAGLPLVTALAEARIFDADTLRLAGTGELTGTLPEMLQKGAEYVRDQHVRQRKMLMRLVGVAITVVFGAIVCYIAAWGALTYFDVMFRGLDWMQE